MMLTPAPPTSSVGSPRRPCSRAGLSTPSQGRRSSLVGSTRARYLGTVRVVVEGDTRVLFSTRVAPPASVHPKTSGDPVLSSDAPFARTTGRQTFAAPHAPSFVSSSFVSSASCFFSSFSFSSFFVSSFLVDVSSVPATGAAVVAPTTRAPPQSTASNVDEAFLLARDSERRDGKVVDFSVVSGVGGSDRVSLPCTTARADRSNASRLICPFSRSEIKRRSSSSGVIFMEG
mmetsp:Transcript_11283/g.35807  ORF Transcript_11283/g.35807 Transcript_11283/m.35807 type:complete len:231 (+) Transcript_11283:2866-3558(+)